MMKNTSTNASRFAKQIISILCSTAKAKSLAIKSKTETIGARLLVLSLLGNKKLSLVALSHKIHSLLPRRGHQEKIESGHDDQQSRCSSPTYHQDHELMQIQVPKDEDLDSHYNPYFNNFDDGDQYPDLTHSLFDDAEDDPNASVIDLVRSSKEEEGQNFSLEDEIDHVADLFIMKFHKKMRMQKLESFKRYQEMHERSNLTT
ncbi:hypothetical protein ACH5RR_001698 [Cinchona calisaya]|uniref:Uncharacterized protein n=1 Tax=Cinchona calisaya TaxID=153742 RepID=A0ABD3B5D4_9GENT